MQALDDMALLREYALRNSEAAFAELVSRRLGFVYSAALRQVRDEHLAGEIAQAVFILLANKAANIPEKTILTGWLFRTTRFTAMAQIRAVAKRQRLAKELQMQTESSIPAPDLLWEQMSSLLDEGLAALGEQDRQALLLRYFENKSLAEVGTALGTNEDTARKRTNRALEKLHRYFSRRGVSSTTAIIAGVISANSIQAAPITLVKSVSAVALTHGAVASTSTLTLIKGALKLMAWTKAKFAITAAATIILATTATTVVVRTSVSSGPAAIYEEIFKHPDGSSLAKLREAPPTLLVRPTRYPNKDGGIWDTHENGVYVGATLRDLIVWAYGGDPTRVVLPDNAPKGNYDYLVTLPNHQKEALREEIKKQFGLVAKHETLPEDVLLLTATDPARLGSFRTKGGSFACYGMDMGNNRQMRFFTNAALSLLARQDVEGYFEKPCIDQTKPNVKYDFALQWQEPAGLAGAARREALRPVILDQLHQLGLELVPKNMPIEMLVVEQAN